MATYHSITCDYLSAQRSRELRIRHRAAAAGQLSAPEQQHSLFQVQVRCDDGSLCGGSVRPNGTKWLIKMCILSLFVLPNNVAFKNGQMQGNNACAAFIWRGCEQTTKFASVIAWAARGSGSAII